MHSVAFSPDGKTILTGSADNTAQLWDAATGQRMGEHPGASRHGLVRGVQPRRPTILTGSHDGTARLWDAEVGQPVGRPLDYGDPVRDVAFSPDGKTLFAADVTAKSGCGTSRRVIFSASQSTKDPRSFAWH